jgi:predicted nucleic acid-binding protein
VAERRLTGVLDTSVVIDLPEIDEALLPIRATITAVTLAELSQGPHLAATPHERSVRLERLQVVEAVFPAPLPFDAAAARRYGSLVALALAAGRAVRPRRIDLMIAATAAVHALPLFTRNGADFEGLQDAVDVVVV